MPVKTEKDYWTSGFTDRPRPGLLISLFATLLGYLYLSCALLLCKVFSRSSQGAATDDLANKVTVLAIGPFFSQNWTAAHVDAMSQASTIETVYVVVPEAYSENEKIQYVVFSKSAARVLGAGIARSIAAAKIVFSKRPTIVIGYHLPWNGVVALILARLAKTKAVYFSVGGPAEFIDGGIYSEHALFSKLRNASPHMESLFVKLINQFDAVFTMGKNAQAYFETIFSGAAIIPMAVGIDSANFSKADTAETPEIKYDVVTVGRLSKIKQVNMLLKATKNLVHWDDGIKVAVVGDGHQRESLERQAKEMAITDNVDFLGWQDDVNRYLRQSKVFVMTSASEGLPHSLIEAMLIELPVVMPDVGEIDDLVENGINGYVFPPNDIERLTESLKNLLSDEDRRREFASAARAAALRHSVAAKVGQWEAATRTIMTG
jgi:glycosyltransferase involved in cell wall biosynthesis